MKSLQIKKRFVPSLKDCCFKSFGALIKKHNSTAILNFLPPVLLNQLVTRLEYETDDDCLLSDDHVVDLFLNGKLTKLNIGPRYVDYFYSEVPEFFAIPPYMYVNFQQLTELNINGLYPNNPETSNFVNLVRNIPNILKLTLDYCNIADTVLRNVGECCLKLEHLSVECNRITDHGIFGLCLSDLENSRPRELPLKYLNVQGTEITIEGAFVALKTLPYLKDFKCEKSFNVFNKYIFEDLRPLKIRSLYAQRAKLGVPQPARITGETAISAAKYCPNAIHLDLHFGYLEDKSLDFLTKFDKLESLSLVSDTHVGNWQPNFYNFFKFRGNRLCKLDLGRYSPCDVGLIAFFCTNLKELKLFSVKYSNDYSNLINPRAFGNLRKLDISEWLGITVTHTSSRDLLTLLGNSSQLEELRLYNVPVYTEDLFALILQQNAFKNLQNVSLYTASNLFEGDSYLRNLEQLLNTATKMQEYELCYIGRRSGINVDTRKIRNLVQMKGYSCEIKD